MRKILTYKMFEEYNFIPDIAKNKKFWYLIDTKEILKISDNIIDLIGIAYKNTTHGSFVNSEEDMLRSTDWYVIDVDNDPDADAVVFGRKTEFGLKIQGFGHDGGKDAKKVVLNKLYSLLNRDGYWIEASDKVEEILYKNNVPYLSDNEEVSRIFPNSNVKMDGNKGRYTRTINKNTTINETVFGKPIFK